MPQPKIFTVWLKSLLTPDEDRKKMKEDQVTSSRNKATSMCFTKFDFVQILLTEPLRYRTPWASVGKKQWGNLGTHELKEQVLCCPGPVHLCPPGWKEKSGHRRVCRRHGLPTWFGPE